MSGKIKHKAKIIIVLIFSMTLSYLIGTNLFDHKLVGVAQALDGVLLFVSIIVGFIGASLSVFATVSDSKFASKLKKSPNSKKQFIGTLKITLFIGVALVALTILYQLLISNKASDIILTVVNFLWLFLIPMFLGLGYIIVNVILEILFSE